jgi:hypothetical protein
MPPGLVQANVKLDSGANNTDKAHNKAEEGILPNKALIWVPI